MRKRNVRVGLLGILVVTAVLLPGQLFAASNERVVEFRLSEEDREFPSAMREGVALTAANIHRKWIGVNVSSLFAQKTGCPVCVINDADAAGLAEMTFGVGQGRKGVVIVVTIGTGLGTALFTNGCLLPNAELGHLQIDGEDAEWRASDAARKREKLSWKQWGARFSNYLKELEKLLWPELFILGGGVSKKFDKFMQYLDVRADVIPAQLLNEAGIVGAASATCLYLAEERNGALA